MNQYVTDGLRVKLAEIHNAIRATEQRLKVLTADKATVMRALRLFEAEETPGTFSLGIQIGAFRRTILDTLREADAGLSARDIADRLASRAGRPLERQEFNMLVARVRNAIPRMSDRLEGELRDRTTYWRVKAT